MYVSKNSLTSEHEPLTCAQWDGDGDFDSPSAMGFTILHGFEEVSCDAASFNMVPPT
jgi:hypothetical protein